MEIYLKFTKKLEDNAVLAPLYNSMDDLLLWEISSKEECDLKFGLWNYTKDNKGTIIYYSKSMNDVEYFLVPDFNRMKIYLRSVDSRPMNIENLMSYLTKIIRSHTIDQIFV